MESYNDLKDSLDTPASIDYSNVQEATIVEVSGPAIGRFYGELRAIGIDPDSNRVRARRFGDVLVARIESEQPQGLGQLFG